MLEFMLASLVTILPDFLIRRYTQGKRWGKEITFFTMWYELRWGVTACMLLTVTLITLIFYYHPSTTNVSPFFRTVSMLPEGGGRVNEVFIENGELVQAGDPLFSLTETTQLAAVAIAKGRIAEIEAAFAVAHSQIAAAQGTVEQAHGALNQARNELRMKRELKQKGAGMVSRQEIQRLEHSISARLGTLHAAQANEKAAHAQLTTVLPSQQSSAEAALGQAEVEFNKTTIYAGVTGRVEQFTLRPGDYINPFLRPAGILVPTETVESGRHMVQAGFNQLTSPVIKVGTLAEITCLTKPFTIIPMVVTHVQDVIAAGQVRPSDRLLDIQDRARPGTLAVWMEPLYQGGLEGVTPGSKCIANAYTNNHELIAFGELGTLEFLYFHMVDAIGIVHAIILRIQTLILPVKILVFSGH